MTFYERFTALRKEQGLTQTEIGEHLGINKNTFTNWKNGVMPVRPTQRLLAQYFGVSVDYLMGKTDIKEKPTTAEGDGLSQEFNYLYNRLTAEQKEIVLAAMREFAKEQ